MENSRQSLPTPRNDTNVSFRLFPAPHETPLGVTPAAAPPDPAQPLGEQAPATLLAMCIFGEARGENETAQRGVAQVVLNRARHPHPVFGSRRGATLEENLRRVILQPGQFSALDPDDPNHAKLLRPLVAEDAGVWEQCCRSAEQSLAGLGREDRLTRNSDHYFDDSIQPPSWADPAKRTVKLGRLNFYRLYLPEPAAPPPAPTGFPPAAAPHHQEPPVTEPSAPSEPSPATPIRLPADGTLPATSLLSPIPLRAWTSRLPTNRREHRRGRLSSHETATSDKWQATSESKGTRGSKGSRGCKGCKGNRRLFPLPHLLHLPPLHLLATRHLSLLLSLLSLCVLLAGCSDLERTAYRTLAVTRAEYLTLQQHMAEAAAHGLITEEQWNRFEVQGHRFMNAHNTAVDAFELWSRTKSQADTARLEAMLEILPRLIRELNSLVESFEKQSEPRPLAWMIHENCGNDGPGRGGTLWPTAAAVGGQAGMYQPRQGRQTIPRLLRRISVAPPGLAQHQPCVPRLAPWARI